MFTVKDRQRVRERILELAAGDARVVGSAVVGSLALSEGDRWSDLDLTFAVADNFPLGEVLADWTRTLVQEFDAAELFDLGAGASIDRVFLLPGCLQFDLSFTPASQFGATGPKFKLLLGTTVEKPQFSRHLHRSFLVTPSIMPCGLASALNVAPTGRPSIGLAVRAITRSASHVVVVTSRHSTVAASMIYPQTYVTGSSRHY
jgi:hypothetical protein